MGHGPVNDNATYLADAIAALDKEVLWGEDGDGALDIAFNLNMWHDWAYYYFGEKVGYDVASQYDEEVADRDNLFWGTDWLYPVVYVADTTYDLYMADAMGETPDIDGAKAAYQDALEDTYDDIANYCEDEVAGMQKVAKILK